MSDYLNSVIYMIKKKDDYDNKNVYIGSTKDFMKRKNCHKNGCNNPNSRGYNMKLYQYIRDNGGWDEWCMVVIQDYPCDSRDELKECEDIIMCEIKSVLNNNRANRSIKEWCIDNRDKLAEKKKDDDDNENVYIGSTKNFTKRKWDHKNNYKNPNNKCYNLKLYEYIRKNGGWNKFVMVVIQDYPCNCKEELELCEDQVICQMNSKLNDKRARRSCKQRYEDNKEKILEQSKKYYENNKEKKIEKMKEYYQNNSDKIKEQHKEYYHNNSDKINKKHKEYKQNNSDKIKEQKKEYYENNKEKYKQYYELNKDKVLEKKKEYRELNKQKIEEKRSEKIKCDKCGSEVRRDGLSAHKKTLKCKDFVH